MGIHTITSKTVSSAISPVNVHDFATSLLKVFPKILPEHGSKHGSRPKQIGMLNFFQDTQC